MPSESEILNLREAYRGARSTLNASTSGLEQEVGLASLRLEATNTYRELVTSGRGLTDEDLAPLKEYVENLTGGEGMEKAVGELDSQAQSFATKALRDVWSSLTGSIVVGVVATVFNIVGFAAVSAQSAGATLFNSIVGGTVAIGAIGRVLYLTAEGSEKAWLKTWGWASSLGVESDRLLTGPRKLQAGLLAQVGGRGVGEAFTRRVRTRAQVVIGVVWLIVAIAVVLVIIGFLGAASDWWDSSKNPLNTTTTPLFGQ